MPQYVVGRVSLVTVRGWDLVVGVVLGMVVCGVWGCFGGAGEGNLRANCSYSSMKGEFYEKWPGSDFNTPLARIWNMWKPLTMAQNYQVFI